MWNCRGSSTIASIDRIVSHRNEPYSVPPSVNSASASGSFAACPKMSPKPPNIPNVTKSPTARKATSLTTDSKAMAATMPSWRSLASSLRVPNTMVKAASTSAT